MIFYFLLGITLMKTRLLSQLTCVIAFYSLIGCGGGGSSKTPAPNPTSTAQSSVVGSIGQAASSASSQAAIADSLLATDLWSSISFWAGDSDTKGSPVGSYSVVNVENNPLFTKAARVVVTKPTGAFWNGQLKFPLKGNLANDDILLIHAYFRSIATTDESGAAFTTLFLEGTAPEYTKYVTRDLVSTGEWVEYFIPLKVVNLKSGDKLELKFGFGAGTKTQTFEVAGLEVLNYHSTVTLGDLPKTQETYGGRELDAPWRAQAAARIEAIRKSDFTLHVKDSTGSPINNASVDIKFKRHAYQFGSVIVSSLLMGTNPDNIKYREKVLELFNQSGTENDLKWGAWDGEWGSDFNKTTTLSALQWLKDRNFYLRGHVLVWPSKRNLPNSVQSYLPLDNPTAADPKVKQVVLDHIDEISTATANLLDEWDVLNEPYDNHYLMDAFGDSVMVDWFKRARANLPTQKLYINDYSILSAGGRDFAHQDHYKKTIQYLVDNNAPINGIGMQSHFSNSPTDLDTVYKILNQFQTQFPTLNIRSTEFDVNTQDEQLQADYTRDFVTMMFSHPSTVGVQMWGFWAGAHWLPDAAMYALDWREKPNAVAWKKLIYETWWNNFLGASNSSGNYSARGFYGTYEATITIAGNAYKYSFNLQKGLPTTFEVAIP
jgi:endo-1,4-beta-xylanase